METGPFIDGLPIKNGWIFPWLTVSHNQRVYIFLRPKTGEPQTPLTCKDLLLKGNDGP